MILAILVAITPSFGSGILAQPTVPENAPDETTREAIEAANAALDDPTQATRALELVQALPNSRTKGHLLLNIARAFAESDRGDDAFSVAQSAVKIDDPLIRAYAWGRIGRLYESSIQPDDALAAARKAVFFAQQARSPDATFEFQWQLARRLRDRDADAAIGAYRRALIALSGIRHDIALSLGRGDAARTFRTEIGPVFYETADLLLRQADRLQDPVQVQRALRDARDTIEQLKSAELEDYFQDDCVNLLRQKQRDIDVGLVGTAVVYVIPLPDRVELLVSTPSGLRRHTVADVTDRHIADEARQFRQTLEDSLDHSYRPHARRLYDWLIRPIDDVLQSEGIRTLVFVPDGELRTISMAALMDGNTFLVDRYAVAVSPALSLTDPQPLARRRNIELLAAGLSESRQDFPALPNVPVELDQIGQLYGGQQLRDEQFQRQQFASRFRGDPYTIVHIASHGQFAASADQTFLLTYDGRLNLNDLEKLIQPSQFRGEPVELLTLSACQTASGDDGSRAALGLAGIAIKSGARSALATLWSVNDQASSELIAEFYRQLRNDPGQTKAQALRAAQLKLRESGYRHPYYWSPYLIIGNWM